MRVNQKITVGSITINSVQNSSIVQIGSSGMIQSQSELIQPPAATGVPSTGTPKTEVPANGGGPKVPQTSPQATMVPCPPTVPGIPFESGNGPAGIPSTGYPEFNFPVLGEGPMGPVGGIGVNRNNRNHTNNT